MGQNLQAWQGGRETTLSNREGLILKSDVEDTQLSFFSGLES